MTNANADISPNLEHDIAWRAEILDELIAIKAEDRRELYLLRARRAMLSMLLKRDETPLMAGRAEVSTDDVRRAVSLPDDIDPACLDAVPGPLVALKIIAPTGTAWRLLNRAGALSWLWDNPDRPDPQQKKERPSERTLFDTN